MCVIDTRKLSTQSRTVPHRWMVYGLVPDRGPGLWVYTASADGTLKHISLESGIGETVRPLPLLLFRVFLAAWRRCAYCCDSLFSGRLQRVHVCAFRAPSCWI